MSGDRIVEFIFPFESADGFNQLFYVTAKLPEPQQGDLILNCETFLRPITTGQWQVARQGITVDENNRVIYFQGKAFYKRNFVKKPKTNISAQN